MKIQYANIAERDSIDALYRKAFPDEESALAANLAIDLLDEPYKAVNLVAVSQSTIAGHIAYSPVTVENEAGLSAYILAPLAVHPDYQHNGVGGALVEYGLQILSNRGANIILVYGDPGYYGRFGFDTETAEQYTPPYTLEYPIGWQAMVLNKCPVERTPASISCVPPLCNPELW